jgi:hypothetical protein
VGPGTGLLGAYLSECLVSVVRKTQLVLPIHRFSLKDCFGFRLKPPSLAFRSRTFSTRFWPSCQKSAQRRSASGDLECVSASAVSMSYDGSSFMLRATEEMS